MEKDTVSMYFVGAAVARLAADARLRVLDIAGVSAELAAVPHARVTADSFAALWLAVAGELDDEFFGLDARRMKVGSFALLCHAALGCGNVERALRQILRGMALFLDEVDGELRLDGVHAVVSIDNRIAGASARLFADETFLIMVHGLTCWLAGKRLALSQVEFAHPKPPHAPEYAAMYSQHVRFEAAYTAIRFDAKFLASPIVQNTETVKRFLRHAPQSVFLKYKNEDSWTARLRRRLRDSIGGTDWPRLQGVAREFGVAPTTLRRRLIVEGTSYKGIKDELRRDAAIHHLCNGELSVAQIGSLLGFQEPSAFHRAFKKWSGVQPGEYRLALRAGVGPPSVR